MIPINLSDMRRDALIVRKRFFDDPERLEAEGLYAVEIGKLIDALVRVPLDTDDWQGLQKEFNSIRVRIEVLQVLAYLITGDRKYNKNVLIQRKVDKPLDLNQFKEYLDEVKRAVMRWPVESSFQRNNVTLNRIHWLNRVEIEE